MKEAVASKRDGRSHVGEVWEGADVQPAALLSAEEMDEGEVAQIGGEPQTSAHGLSINENIANSR